jgi:uncharacterized protein
MPETFLHGVELLEVDTGSRPIRSVRSSVIGLVGGGNNHADFPLDTPVLITSAKDVKEKLGASSWLGNAIENVFKQGSALVVAVRTDDVLGSLSQLTGVYALRRAQADLGYTPRVIVGEAFDNDQTALKEVAASLRAVALVGINETEATDATRWSDENGNDRTFAIWPYVNGGQDPAPFVAGVIARTDNDRGFWWSPSNQEVFGINSLDQPVDFQLGDNTSLANIVNEGKVTTFIRQGGFRVWGNLTGSIDPKYQFLSVRRTADIINDSILRAHLWAVDRNITKTYLQDVAEGVNAYLATLQNLGAIIGGRCWPDPDLNSPDQIALGKVYFNFEFTPPYPAQTVIFRSILTNDYLTELL